MERNIKRLTDNRELRYEEGDLGIWNRYTAGVAGQRWLEALKNEGKIMGSRCPKCNTLYVPARLFCERCFARIPDEAWEEVGTRAKLYSYTVVHRGPDEKPLQKPLVLGLLEFGDSDGARMLHLVNADPKTLKMGMVMEAELKPPTEREGSILDIKWFRPT